MPKYKHGSGSVYKRSKTFWLSYYMNGQRVRESAYTADRAEARRLLQQRLGQIAGDGISAPLPTGSLLRTWCRNCRPTMR